jgi:hypothetical protein
MVTRDRLPTETTAGTDVGRCPCWWEWTPVGIEPTTSPLQDRSNVVHSGPGRFVTCLDLLGKSHGGPCCTGATSSGLSSNKTTVETKTAHEWHEGPLARHRSHSALRKPIKRLPARDLTSTHVTIDFAGFTSETLRDALTETLDMVRAGRLAPETIALRVLAGSPARARRSPYHELTAAVDDA